MGQQYCGICLPTQLYMSFQAMLTGSPMLLLAQMGSGLPPLAETKPSAMDQLAKGKEIAAQGKIKEAITAYEESQSLDPMLHIGAYQWNTLCWFGSLYQKAQDVIFACERAVALAPSGLSGRNRRRKCSVSGRISSRRSASDGTRKTQLAMR
jgi:hypothetical protein